MGMLEGSQRPLLELADALRGALVYLDCGAAEVVQVACTTLVDA